MRETERERKKLQMKEKRKAATYMEETDKNKLRNMEEKEQKFHDIQKRLKEREKKTDI